MDFSVVQHLRAVAGVPVASWDAVVHSIRVVVLSNRVDGSRVVAVAVVVVVSGVVDQRGARSAPQRFQLSNRVDGTRVVVVVVVFVVADQRGARSAPLHFQLSIRVDGTSVGALPSRAPPASRCSGRRLSSIFSCLRHLSDALNRPCKHGIVGKWHPS